MPATLTPQQAPHPPRPENCERPVSLRLWAQPAKIAQTDPSSAAGLFHFLSLFSGLAKPKGGTDEDWSWRVRQKLKGKGRENENDPMKVYRTTPSCILDSNTRLKPPRTNLFAQILGGLDSRQASEKTPKERL